MKTNLITDSDIETLYLQLRLLEMEVDALRSVLSEWDTDKSCYLRMNFADAIEQVLNGMKRP